ncbi:glycine cleavage system aminomethyltransferase GcvT [Haliea sp. E1-2-M8]|uniref:glycine cleavage system aminomethyltransferase GcvT n=1 Tax=Haliea sp. E1-2-M8 TaxID=3064706 RepID=UPI00271D0D01|nr:glycine cleavage system aminomethyltransferase GcvT [Haliea sp. E1-2-M8]MDO8861038.1 glycine cleavage system aminomethyltransferase GcvT [Haliea sp. E1-2-M8]
MTLLHTPLDALHRELGARMVPFAGYDMPVQYPAGIIKEHLHTRQAAGLFDVSHMGQVVLSGAGSAELLEALVPADVVGLADDRQTYALLTNSTGGVLDDLIITRWGPETFFLVVNAACKEQDIAHLRAHLDGQSLEVMADQALLALQGPAAREVMARLCAAAAALTFMHGMRASIDGVELYITCSGYTGEDGFELSLPAVSADRIARLLLAQPEVAPIGLGARDSLRLEAGLCLYGHELSATIDPVQAGLVWSIGKARRPGGERPGGFPGADRIFQLVEHRPPLRRVGLVVDGKRPVREGQTVFDERGEQVGEVCSACFGASVGVPIAIAYVRRDGGEPGTRLIVDVRGKPVSVTVAKMPFVPQRYFRG